ADLDFAGALLRLSGQKDAEGRFANATAHLSLYQDETSQHCQWHLPEAHYLEAWGDARAYDGTVSIVQPLIAPLYNGRSAYEVLSALTEYEERPGLEIVQGYWRSRWPSSAGNFERHWRKTLHDGVMPQT